MYKQKVILFFSCLVPIFFLLILSVLFFLKHPLYTPAAFYWVKNAITVKEHYCHTITKPKIFIISGSNSFYGICTPLLKEKTNMEIVNFGVTYLLSLKSLFVLIKRNTNPNDIVIMPLEYEYYLNKNITEVEVNILTTWGTDILFELSPLEILEILVHAIPNYYKRFKDFNFNLPILTYNEYIKNKNLTAILTTSRDYSVNYWGDYTLDVPSLLENNYTKNPFKEKKIKNTYFRQLKSFSDFLAKQNIKLLLTYPVSIQNQEFDLTNKKHLNIIKTLNKKFKEYELNYIGIPELSNFELNYSSDHYYHLNAEGAVLRSLYLADSINSYLENKPQQIPDLEAYKNEKKKEAKKILEEYRKLGYFSE